MNGLQVNQLLQSAQGVSQNSGIKKRCARCKETKPIEVFSIRRSVSSGRDCYCRKCSAEITMQRRKANPEYGRIQAEASKKWQKSNSKKCCESARRWRERNPEKYLSVSRRAGAKIRGTPKGTLNNRMAVAMNLSLKCGKQGHRWESLVGYTVNDLKEHLENLFREGMNWERLMKGEIHIDHIIPKSVFSFEKPEDEDFKRCWALSNLQPLWAEENLSKYTTQL